LQNHFRPKGLRRGRNGHFGNITGQRRGAQSHFHHFDPLGSTTELTNATGDVTDTRRYKAFGETVQQSGSTTFPFQFVGQKGYYRDAERGTYYVRRRDSRSQDGRWLSSDPFSERLRTLNPYVYAYNSPTRLIDPSGLKPQITCSPVLLSKPEYSPQFGNDYYDLDVVNEFGDDYYDWMWGYMRHSGVLVAGAKLNDSEISIYANVNAGLWGIHDVFNVPYWQWASAKDGAGVRCPIQCNVDEVEGCLISTTCHELAKEKEIDKYWAVAYRYLLDYNSPIVLTISYGADSAFAYSSPDIDFNLGGNWVGAGVTVPGGEFEFKASRKGSASWICKCKPALGQER
jgi:RHS repeat-associated protein